jgi:hippurate hydrolase
MNKHPLVDALRAHEAEMIDIRHQIHRNPEVGFEETQTAALVAKKLREFGLEVTEGIAKTGVVATL